METVVPVMTLLPQVAPVPHSYFAPLPSLPPVAVKVVALLLEQRDVPKLLLMPVGAVGLVQAGVTVTTTDAQPVVLLQGAEPTLRTQ